MVRAPLNCFPLTQEDLSNFKSAAEKYILPGYAPPAPFLARNSPVTTVGSCFAQNIGETLVKLGTPANWIQIDENNNTPFITDWFFSKIVSGEEKNAKNVLQVRASALLIVTVGVALHRFAGGVPEMKGNAPEDVEAMWRMFSVEQLSRYLRSIVSKARTINPDVHIVITLSPIPLKASPNHPSVFGQDCLSKSLLRVAIDIVVNERIANLSYWPSFEMIRWLGGHAGPYYGTGAGAQDNRHVSPEVLDTIMSLFIERYFMK